MNTHILIAFFLAVALYARAEDSTTNSRPMMSRALLHNTVRIEIQKANGSGGLGTGFFYVFDDPTRTSSVPVIVTCKHVIAGSLVGRIHFALGITNSFVRSQDDFPLVFPNFEQMWIPHPDTNVDLAVLPLAPIFRHLESEGKYLEFDPVGEKLIPDKDELPKYGVFQEVKFIGYPIGIWDEKNNLPIVRRGMTATDPVVDYNGRSEFLIDAAVFPGSSGSPVYIANEGMNFFDGGVYSGSRIKLLGILYAVNEYASDGKVEVVTIPTAFDVKVKTSIPANLGLVIKAERLADFKRVFDDIEKMREEMLKKKITTPSTSPEKL